MMHEPCSFPETPVGRALDSRARLDTDPGGDDVFALLWLRSLARQGRAEIVAVTTVAGNVQNQYTFVNAYKTLALGGFEQVEVGRAASAREYAEDAAYIHGTDGMGNLSRTLPPPACKLADARRADEIIIEKLSAAPSEITLVAVGPLTNLAAAEEKSPGILAKAKEVVVMGGAFRREGNVTSHAEFNVCRDLTPSMSLAQVADSGCLRSRSMRIAKFRIRRTFHQRLR